MSHVCACVSVCVRHIGCSSFFSNSTYPSFLFSIFIYLVVPGIQLWSMGSLVVARGV